MHTKPQSHFFVIGCLIFLILPLLVYTATDQVTTNKEKVLTIAVQGKVAPAQPSRSYVTTWNGKAKMAIGVGGINYNLQLGKHVFGWANGDRATMGVATTGQGSNRANSGWEVYTSIGNEVRLLSGEARGEKGVVIGKFRGFVLIHFPDEVLEKLTIGNRMQVKARGVGLKIKGFDDVFPHGIDPVILEKIAVKKGKNKLEVPVVKIIPAEIVGQGAGSGSLTGIWHIQTCYPPDIKKYGLHTLRFGDLVLLKDVQTDYGKGYYEGGATLGVVCSGPSDRSGLGIGVTPILSTRFGKIVARIDNTANIGKFLGLKLKMSHLPKDFMAKLLPQKSKRKRPGTFKTNKDRLITTAVEAVVHPAGSRGYSTTYDGKPKISIGMASINYTVSVGDSAYGWASADHVEPDVTVQGRDRERAGECAIALLACIGNEARILTGEAKGSKGYYLGRHAGSDDLVWFSKQVLEKLAINDIIQVRAQGVGLKIKGFEDVRLNKMSPRLLESIGVRIKKGKLVIPVVMEIPGHIMGSGLGYGPIESLDYDIQTTDPKTVKKYGLKKIKIGDLVAIRDHYDNYGTGRYKGAVTIGVCIHGWSDFAGHGPGLNPVIAALPGKVEVIIDANANIAYYLGIKPHPNK